MPNQDNRIILSTGMALLASAIPVAIDGWFYGARREPAPRQISDARRL